MTVWQMDVQHSPPCVVQRLEIAQRLGHFEHAKRIWRPGDRNIHFGGRRDDEEHTVVGSALVPLSGRMQIRRSLAEHRGAAHLNGDAVAELAKKRIERRGGGWK